jgi:hypothetical protein
VPAPNTKTGAIFISAPGLKHAATLPQQTTQRVGFAQQDGGLSSRAAQRGLPRLCPRNKRNELAVRVRPEAPLHAICRRQARSLRAGRSIWKCRFASPAPAASSASAQLPTARKPNSGRTTSCSQIYDVVEGFRETLGESAGHKESGRVHAVLSQVVVVVVTRRHMISRCSPIRAALCLGRGGPVLLAAPFF